MYKLTNKELKSINGGSNISAALINAFVKGINEIILVGKTLGSAIRRIVEGNMCNLD